MNLIEQTKVRAKLIDLAEKSDWFSKMEFLNTPYTVFMYPMSEPESYTNTIQRTNSIHKGLIEGIFKSVEIQLAPAMVFVPNPDPDIRVSQNTVKCVLFPLDVQRTIHPEFETENDSEWLSTLLTEIASACHELGLSHVYKIQETRGSLFHWVCNWVDYAVFGHKGE